MYVIINCKSVYKIKTSETCGCVTLHDIANTRPEFTGIADVAQSVQ